MCEEVPSISDPHGSFPQIQITQYWLLTKYLYRSRILTVLLLGSTGEERPSSLSVKDLPLDLRHIEREGRFWHSFPLFCLLFCPAPFSCNKFTNLLNADGTQMILLQTKVSHSTELIDVIFSRVCLSSSAFIYWQTVLFLFQNPICILTLKWPSKDPFTFRS